MGRAKKLIRRVSRKSVTSGSTPGPATCPSSPYPSVQILRHSSNSFAMGITGLLPLLGSITKTTHLAQFAGLRVAIDAYVWLHRGAYGCSYELCQNTGTHKYVPV